MRRAAFPSIFGVRLILSTETIYEERLLVPRLLRNPRMFAGSQPGSL